MSKQLRKNMMLNINTNGKGKGKGKVKVVDLYSASSWETSPLRRPGVDHTVLPANNTTPAFTRSSPGGATTEWTVTAPADEAYYSLIDAVRMKGWVCLVGWPIADVWSTKWSSVQLAVRRRTGKVRRSKTSVLPLCYAAKGKTMLQHEALMHRNQQVNSTQIQY